MLVIKLAWRSLWRNTRRTLITLTSIAIGLALALLFATIAQGVYHKAIEDAVHLQGGHLRVEHPAYRDSPSPDRAVSGVASIAQTARAIPGVDRVKALTIAQAVVSTGAGSSGVTLVGVEPDEEQVSSPIPSRVKAGRYLRADDSHGVVIGTHLAKRLSLDVGKKLVLTTNDANGTLVSELLRVTGIFEMGSDDVDGYLAQVPIDASRRMLGMSSDQATEVSILLHEQEDQPRVHSALAAALAGQSVAIVRWEEVLPELAGWIQLDSKANRLLRSVILFLVSFTILSTILISVVERHREFAMLLALGTSPGLLRQQIVVESAFLGALGSIAGIILGGALCGYLQIYGFDLHPFLEKGMSVGGFAIDMLVHTRVTAATLWFHGGMVFVVTILIGLYPTYRSTRVDVATALRSR